MKNERKEIGKMTEAQFRDTYFYKEELVAFLRLKGLPVGGGKEELTERIAVFLRDGSLLKPEKTSAVKKLRVEIITPDTLIEENLTCSQVHRAFFKEQIGKSFTFFTEFQDWLHDNAGKTYGEAVSAYGELLYKKKHEKKEIASQFAYNTYIRDFFADNPGRTLSEAIRCWNYKKAIPGEHRYEKSDLTGGGIG